MSSKEATDDLVQSYELELTAFIMQIGLLGLRGGYKRDMVVAACSVLKELPLEPFRDNPENMKKFHTLIRTQAEGLAAIHRATCPHCNGTEPDQTDCPACGVPLKITEGKATCTNPDCLIFGREMQILDMRPRSHSQQKPADA